jgi:RNA polymerase sigma-70 factor (ECF subfamily)
MQPHPDDLTHWQDSAGLATLFARNRQRLRAIVELRLDRRLQGRIDPSDVLQEAFIEISRRAAEYAATPTMPPFLWLRFLTVQQIINVHRRQLGTQRRNADRDVSLGWNPSPQATTMVLAAQLLGKLTSPVDAALRAERQMILHDALDRLGELDREVIALRHFEELTNQETAEVLGLHKDTASKRYLRAMKRLKEILASYPGFFAPGNGDES